jgi:hypothetical protein
MNIKTLDKIIEIKENINKDIWIYFLFQDEDLVYIWKSKNLSNRIFQHKKRWLIFNYISKIYCEEKDLLKLETLYLNNFSTKYNLNKKSIEVCLPKIEVIISASDLRKIINRLILLYPRRKIIYSKNYFNSLKWRVNLKQEIDLFLNTINFKINYKTVLNNTYWIKVLADLS